MTPLAHRQLLTSFRHGAHSRRLVHTSSPARATALSPSAFALEELEELTIPPIFDIFDAPVRLGESKEFIRDQVQSPVQKPRTSVFGGPLPRPTPSSLPPPIIFDGPARPRHLSIAFQARRSHRSTTSSSIRRHHTPSIVPFNSPEPLVQLFEGPARITRYSHKSRSRTDALPSYHMLLLGFAGAFGCVTLVNNSKFTWAGPVDAKDETVFRLP